jgi:predicted transposase/invertase (TIGR01784 family)
LISLSKTLTNEHYFKDFELNFVELPKFQKKLEEGEKIGFEKGMKQKAVQAARELLKNGVSIDIIVKSSGLTKEEIKKLI